jgi:hypothetical protein
MLKVGMAWISSEIGSFTVVATASCASPKLHLVSRNLTSLLQSCQSALPKVNSYLCSYVTQSFNQHSIRQSCTWLIYTLASSMSRYPSWKARRSIYIISKAKIQSRMESWVPYEARLLYCKASFENRARYQSAECNLLWSVKNGFVEMTLDHQFN